VFGCIGGTGPRQREREVFCYGVKDCYEVVGEGYCFLGGDVEWYLFLLISMKRKWKCGEMYLSKEVLRDGS
jgi:hypothetical protein